MAFPRVYYHRHHHHLQLHITIARHDMKNSSVPRLLLQYPLFHTSSAVTDLVSRFYLHYHVRHLPFYLLPGRYGIGIG